MITDEHIQYAYMEKLKRQSFFRQKYLHNLKLEKINNIRDYIIAGGDPSTNPEYRDDYFELFAESNGEYFTFDDNVGVNVPLTKEEQEI